MRMVIRCKTCKQRGWLNPTQKRNIMCPDCCGTGWIKGVPSVEDMEDHMRRRNKAVTLGGQVSLPFEIDGRPARELKEGLDRMLFGAKDAKL